MSPWLLHFLDGSIFFVGLLATGIALGLRLAIQKKWPTRLLNFVVIFGVILVLISAAPLPIWAYPIWCGLVLALLLWPSKGRHLDSESDQQNIKRTSRIPLFLYFACVAVTLGIFFIELPYHLRPHVSIEENTPVYIVGDSLSAGIGREKETWSTIYAKKSGHEVINLAVAGATAKTAMKQVASIPQDEPTVTFVEIGGNDLLGIKKSDFRTDLDQLLGELSQKKTRIILFELPLPPLGNRYGSAQRELAQKYNATLIPKRYLAQALCTDGGTLDGLHLSKKGHEKLAETVYRLEESKQ